MAHLATRRQPHHQRRGRLHSDLLKQTCCGFRELWPEKFTNVTNGVTPGAGSPCCQPAPGRPAHRAIGDGWIPRPRRQLRSWSPCRRRRLPERWRRSSSRKATWPPYIRRQDRHRLVDPDSLFDVQVKRIHEYKRQHLNVLHIVTLYLRSSNGPAGHGAAHLPLRRQGGPRLRHGQADHQADQRRRRHRQQRPRWTAAAVVFLPDYNVKLPAHLPAADLSEQISTAGKEASGTGNMKFAMNGALTIGTLDGANVEIREQVGGTTSSCSASPPRPARPWPPPTTASA
jgi:glycogen phosphorylase